MSEKVSEVGFADNKPCSKYQELIDEVGGKAASLVVQKNAGNDDLLMPLQILKPNDIENGDFEIDGNNWGKKIVRGSASGDERGLVDVITTVKGVDADNLTSGLKRNFNIDDTDQSIGNPLALRMYQSGLGLREIAIALGLEKESSTDTSMSTVDKNRESERLGKLISDHIDNQEENYRPSPFFMCQAPLGIEFSQEDRRLLEYGSLEGNPLLRVIESSRAQGIVNYAKNWDGLGHYSGVNSVVVQDMANGIIKGSEDLNMQRRGSIIEHPNIEGHYLINIVVEEGQNKGLISQYLINNKGKLIAADKPNTTLSQDEIQVVLQEILRMKIRTRKVGFIDDGFSSQVEFGFDRGEVKTFQERRFLPYDFTSNSVDETYSFNRFGNPEKLGKLRVVNLGDSEISSDLFTDGEPSVYIPNFDMIGAGIMPSFFPNNMLAILIGKRLITKIGKMLGTAGGNSLEHNTYRYALKAGSIVMGSDRDTCRLRTGDSISL